MQTLTAERRDRRWALCTSLANLCKSGLDCPVYELGIECPHGNKCEDMNPHKWSMYYGRKKPQWMKDIMRGNDYGLHINR